MAINPRLSVSSHMFLLKSYINVTFANILLSWKSFYDLPGPIYVPQIVQILCRDYPEFGFLVINPKLGVLSHMLLHKSYINMAIANILLYQKGFYDLHRPRYGFVTKNLKISAAKAKYLNISKDKGLNTS